MNEYISELMSVCKCLCICVCRVA